MVKLYELISSILKFIINAMFVIQITLVIVVFLSACYWFFSLIGFDFFNFAKPIADWITDFVKLFYAEDILMGGLYIDASILLFDVAAGLVVFGLTKLKYYIYRAIDIINCKTDKEKQRVEDEFNKNLQKEAEVYIKRFNNAAVLVCFSAKNLFPEFDGNNKDEAAQKSDEAFNIFYAALKNITGCKFAKTGDKMLILLDNFDKIDNLLNFVGLTIDRIKINMKKKRWFLSSYIAVQIYDNSAKFKEDVYPLLEKLVSIKHPNDILTTSLFGTRYKLQKEQMYNVVLKGSYNFDESYDVWTLIKKI